MGEFAERVGRSVSTARWWDAEGWISARRLPFGQWYCDNSDNSDMRKAVEGDQ